MPIELDPNDSLVKHTNTESVKKDNLTLFIDDGIMINEDTEDEKKNDDFMINYLSPGQDEDEKKNTKRPLSKRRR